MQFTEVKQTLSGERREYGCQLLEQREGRLVLGHHLPEGGAVEALQIPAGSRTLAYYWQQHPYNVYHFLAPGGGTLGFYFNLSGPVYVGEDHVVWQDMVVDVLIVPDPTLGYRVEVLDEDEVPDDLDPATRSHIDAALAEVMASWPAVVRAISAHSARLVGGAGR